MSPNSDEGGRQAGHLGELLFESIGNLLYKQEELKFQMKSESSLLKNSLLIWRD